MVYGGSTFSPVINPVEGNTWAVNHNRGVGSFNPDSKGVSPSQTGELVYPTGKQWTLQTKITDEARKRIEDAINGK